jgi:hypothetical protein
MMLTRASGPPRRSCARTGHLGEAAGHVAGAAGAVDDHLARLRVEARGDGVLPEPVDAAAHQVVHQVVVLGDAVEDPAHQAGLQRGSTSLKPNVAGLLMTSFGRALYMLLRY